MRVGGAGSQFGWIGTSPWPGCAFYLLGLSGIFFFFFTTLMVEGFSRLKSSYLFIYIYIFKLSRDVLEALKGLAVT